MKYGIKNSIKYCLLVALTTLSVMLTLCAHNVPFDGWKYRADLTFSGYDGTTTLTNFPVLVSVTNFPGFRYSQCCDQNGGDLRFFDVSNAVELNYEIDSWNTSGASYAWVQVPKLAESSTSIRAYWGNPTAEAPTYTGDGSTWSNGYVAVYHLSETSGMVLDSTANNNNSSDVVGDVLRQQVGTVGSAYSFDGSGDYISVPDSPSLDGMAALTIEVWALDEDTNTSNNRTMISKRQTSANKQRSYYFFRQLDRDLFVYVNDSGKRFTGSAVPADGWHHLVFTFDAAISGNELKLFTDGNFVDQMNHGSAYVIDRDDPLLIGRLNGNNSGDWKGMLDEIRISNVARSTDWLRASWQTVAGNTTFSTYGAAALTSFPFLRTDSACAITTTSATLGGTLEESPSETTVTVFWGRSDGGTSADAWETNHVFAVYGDEIPATFSHTATGLAADATWYVRHRAVNSAGTNWSATSTAFINGELTLQASIPEIAEEGTDVGVFTVSRPPGTEELDTVVEYEVAGTATAGEDYVALSGSVVIPAGQVFATIEVAPVPDFNIEGNETIAVKLLPGAYALGEETEAIVTITDYIPYATGTTNVWIGSGNASVITNWSLGHVPTAQENIFLTGFSTADMIWNAGVDNLPTNVASWTQDNHYTGTVFIEAPFSATEPVLVVEGDAVLEGGAWSHSGATASETAKLFARVEGDMIVGAGASVNVHARGFRWTAGPGYAVGGAAHGGEGATVNSWTKTYGSVFHPDRWGSGGGKSPYSGGGRIHLEVAGTLTVAGSVSANGHGKYNNVAAGSGGSILLSVGALEGDGVISADGGLDDWSGNGGGGRIAIHLRNDEADRSQFTGSVSARGTGNQKYVQGSYESGCGTVYWQMAHEPEGGGTVYVINPFMLNRTSTIRRSCHLPPAQNTDEVFGQSDWVVQENAHLKLMHDVCINSLEIEESTNPSAFARLNLNSRTLRTRTLTILGTSYPAGTYSATDFPEGRVIDDEGETSGQIVIIPCSTLLMLR